MLLAIEISPDGEIGLVLDSGSVPISSLEGGVLTQAEVDLVNANSPGAIESTYVPAE